MVEQRVIVGDCREVMASMGAESVDAIVCDPPYGLEFMGAVWDHLWDERPNGGGRKNHVGNDGHFRVNSMGRPGPTYRGGVQAEEWHLTWTRQALRVLRPGGYLLAFGGTRTYHRLTCAIEDAGFEIKDCLCWLYGSGFPKHKSLLKPAWEPIVVAKKRGAGGLNIEACRVECGERPLIETEPKNGRFAGAFGQGSHAIGTTTAGRWPANVALDETAAAMLDAQSGHLQSGHLEPHHERHVPKAWGGGWSEGEAGPMNRGPFGGDSGGASRFFYVAKADKAEREIGMVGASARFAPTLGNGIGAREHDPADPRAYRGNHHPTVKPLALMCWLVRLVTPPGGLVLDPFLGSGTTLIACDREGFRGIGIEMSEEYAVIAEARIRGDAPLFAEVTLEGIA